MLQNLVRSLTLLICVTMLGACSDKMEQTQHAVETKKETPQAAASPQHAALFAPLPEVPVATTPEGKALVALGEKLYFDPILSLAQDISCNSCHLLDQYGVDGEPTSPGHKGQLGDRNSPTTYNAFFHIAQFWDGRAADVEEQALGPVLNPVEMAMPDEATVVKRLEENAEYPALFKGAFPAEESSLTYANVGKAIGAFERTLVTPSRFDDYLKGDANALTPEEIAGLNTFVEVGCTACHIGAGVGGSMYQKLGLVKPYETEDTGRFKATGVETDKYFFKVPSLRNIEKTGPYFHDGSIASLDEAIRLMGSHQLGRDLTDEQVASITTFLKALTGPLPEKYQTQN